MDRKDFEAIRDLPGKLICRLDVDGPAHRPVGRSHKHSLQRERDPERNLPDHVVDRSDLGGESLAELFAIFCELAQIVQEGTFIAPSAT